MEIDTTYGNVDPTHARQMAESLVCAHPIQAPLEYPAGATEPWISALVATLLKATGVPAVLETGSFMGHTSAWLGQALLDMGGGTLWCCEIDPERAALVSDRLDGLELSPSVDWRVYPEDVREVIKRIPNLSLGVAFIDDDHTQTHVAEEIDLLWPKMAPNGLLLFHDVFGSCDLHSVVTRYGGFCLDFPRNGPAGGLGIIQLR